MASLLDIEGIGEFYCAKLKHCGVTSTQNLLQKGSTLSGRKALAEESGIELTLIAKWVNRADLARIKGIGGEYADLLKCSGVDTVPELARRNGANLHRRMQDVNNQKKLVRSLPSSSMVEDWIRQAKKMPRVIHY